MQLKYSLLTLFVLSLLALKSKAQTETFVSAKQLEHTKTVFEDKESGNLYWPQGLPVFVRLAAQSANDAPSFLLDNIDKGNGKKIKNTDGIKLELSGSQFIRWINVVSKGETKFKFFSDGDAPIISHKFNNSPKYISKGITFYGKGLQCTFTATDKLSGVKNLYLSVDGATYAPNTAPVEFATEKAINLQYYAVDKVGYFNKPISVSFTVDLQAPATQYSVETNFINEILSPSTTIALKSLDNLSGVNKIYYKFDNQSNFSVYSKKLKLNKLSNGEHKLTYYSIDNVKNAEIHKEYSFYYDKNPAQASIAISGNQYKKGSKEYVSMLSLVKFSATDDKSEVKNIQYAINKSKQYSIYENPFPLSLKSGPFTVNYFAEDKLGNKSAIKTKAYQMDLVPPVTSFTVSAPKYVQRNTTIWVTKDTKISLSGKDVGAGLEKIHYVIGSSEEKIYQTPIQVTEEGNLLCRFWSTDKVGNREGDNVLLLIGDNAAPEIKEIFSVSPVETKKNSQGENVNVYIQYTSLFMAATDMSSGLRDVSYSLNGKPEKKYSSAILLDKIGEFEINIRAVDNLGHEATKNIKFEIRKLSATNK